MRAYWSQVVTWGYTLLQPAWKELETGLLSVLKEVLKNEWPSLKGVKGKDRGKGGAGASWIRFIKNTPLRFCNVCTSRS
jgi:hypothetical protein